MAETASVVRLSNRGEDCLRTGPGTPAGRYLRQFWQPIYHSTDLAAGRARRQHPQRQRQPERNHRRPRTHDERQQQRSDDAHAERPFETRGQIGQARLFPARQRTDAHEEDRRRHQRHEHAVEIRRAD